MSTVYTLGEGLFGQPLSIGFLGSPGPDVVSGSEQTDLLFGADGADTLDGAAGDDFLGGEVDDDSLDGGDGADFLFVSDNQYNETDYVSDNFSNQFGGDGQSTQFLIDEWFDVFNIAQVADPGVDLEINGGAGFDTVSLDFSFDAGVDPLNFTAPAVGATLTLPNGVTEVSDVEAFWIRGTKGDDTVVGGASGDRLYGDLGDDVLNGGGGDDFVFGGLGADALRGGAGDDFLVATNVWNEFARADNGLATVPVEFLRGLHNIALVSAVADPNIDTLIDGGADDDTAVLDFGAVVNSTLPGAAGVDFTLDPTATVALPFLGTQLRNVEAVWVIDSTGQDDITGGDLADTFFSIDTGTSDRFDGGDGIDTFGVNAASVINLANGQTAGGAATDTLTSIENLVGSTEADQFTGGDEANAFWGRAGADTLNGAGGDDTLDGGADGDRFNGGGGVDTVSYASSVEGVQASLLNPGQNDGDAQGDSYQQVENLTGSRKSDNLAGDNNANVIDGGLGTDFVFGQNGDDTLLASAGNDSFTGGAGADTIVFSGDYSDYSFLDLPGLLFAIVDDRGESFDGVDQFSQVENFVFADQTRTLANLRNAAPTDIVLSAATVAENSDAGTVVGALSATDLDGDALTFSEVGNATAFDVVGNQIRVAAGVALDFETFTSQAITVQANDGKGGTTTQTFTINLTNVNEAPTDIALSNATIAENAAGGLVGALSASDLDTGAGGLTFEVVSGQNLFEVVGSSLRVRSGVTLDFEAGATRNVTIRASDGANTFQEVFTINLTDVAEAIRGTQGPDTLAGTLADDTMLGLGGNDTLFGSLGADTISGGAGVDTVRYTAGVRLDLNNPDNNSGQAAGDVFGGVERFEFSNQVDVVTGSTGADSFSAGGGNDIVNGIAGNDTLLGGSGNDQLNGGTGVDRLGGGLGNDVYTIDSLGDVVVEAANGGTDTVRSTVDETLSANVERLTLIGTRASDGTGNVLGNLMTGNNSANILKGLAGNDVLNAGGGADRLEGGAGADRMDGGAGNDIFVFGVGGGRDRIANFDGGAGLSDRLLFDDRIFQDDADVFAALRQSGDNVIIRLSANDFVTLEGVERASLSGDDFSFF